MMSLWFPSSSSLFSKSFNGNTKSATSCLRTSADVPDFLSADWLESRRKRPFGPRLSFSAEESVQYQLDELMFNDQPRPDYGVEVMYRVQAPGNICMDWICEGPKEAFVIFSHLSKLGKAKYIAIRQQDLIEAYKRVGSMIHNGEKSHGIIGVIDVTHVMV